MNLYDASRREAILKDILWRFDATKKELKDHERLKCKIVVQPSWAWSWTGNDWKRL